MYVRTKYYNHHQAHIKYLKKKSLELALNLTQEESLCPFTKENPKYPMPHLHEQSYSLSCHNDNSTKNTKL